MDQSLVTTMLASAAAGMAARIPCHPIDTCKARLQVQTMATGSSGTMYRGLVDAMAKTFRVEGLRGLYRGFGVAFVGSAPAGCLYFTSYELSKSRLERLPVLSQAQFTAHFTAGMIAEAISCVLFVPIDVIKERMQIQRYSPTQTQAVYYRNGAHAVQTILRTEGLRGIYKGYWATLGSFGPFSGLYFLFYEKTKRAAQSLIGSSRPEDMPFGLSLLSAAAAGGAASFVTNPLDLVKLRLQVQRANRAASAASASSGTAHASDGLGFHYKGMADGLSSVIRREGFAGLFRGAAARVMFHAPATAVGMAAFERFKVLLE